MHQLLLHLDTTAGGPARVRFLIDGVDLLASTGMMEANDSVNILDSGALLPTDPPRRIAFYGCDCGTFGCANVAGLITRDGDVVRWHDFRSVTGVYDSALPEPEDRPDPITKPDFDLSARRLDLPTLTFDAARYLHVVESATAEHRRGA